MSLIQDARFSRLHTDPRFQRQPKKERRNVVDQRFSAMLDDEDFQDQPTAVDRYGRKQAKKAKKVEASAKVADKAKPDRLANAEPPRDERFAMLPMASGAKKAERGAKKRPKRDPVPVTAQELKEEEEEEEEEEKEMEKEEES